jgi:cell division protein FtsQ
MAKQKLYKILGKVLWMLIVSGVVFLMLTAMRSKQQQACAAVVVNIDAVDGKIFIDEKEVKRILKSETGTSLEGSAIARFNLRKLEELLMKDVWIENAELYFDNTGVLHVNIAERVPIARIFDTQGSSYYLDSTGMPLPLSETDRADVPVFTSIPALNKNNKAYYDTILTDVITMANIIRRDVFWNQQIASVDLAGNRHYEVFPAIGFHTIEWGNADNTAEKLGKLKAFYQEVLAKKSLTAYSKISVAYKGQVVAGKGAATMPGIDSTRALQVFNQLVSQTKNEVNAHAIQSEKDNGRIMPEFAGSARHERQDTKTNKPMNKPSTVATPASVVDSAPAKPKALMPPKNNDN